METGADAWGDVTLVEQMKYILNPTSDTEYGGGSLGQDIYTAITEGLGIDDMDEITESLVSILDKNGLFIFEIP